MRVHEIPEGSKTSKGRAIQNIVSIPKEDKVLSFVPVADFKDDDFLDNHFVIFCTKNGVVKKSSMRDYSRPRSNGIIAIKINEGDELREVKLTNGQSDIIIATRKGRAIRFNEHPENGGLRGMGRNAAGVRGVKLDGADDEVVGMVCVNDGSEETVLVVSEQGFGKRSHIDDPESGEANYRVTRRGGKGVKTISVTEKTGSLISIKSVMENDDLMIICKSGIAIRMTLDNIRVMGRATQGVRLINLNDDDEIAAVAKIPTSDDDDEENGEENGEEINESTENGASEEAEN